MSTPVLAATVLWSASSIPRSHVRVFRRCFGSLLISRERPADSVIVVFWCVLGFVAAGFEHVVANMTTFAIGLLGGGKFVGGDVVIGLAYAFVAGRANSRSTEDVSV